MSAFDTEDLKTEINTILDEPDTPMEGVNDSSAQNSPTKSILKSPSVSFRECDFKKEFLDESHTSKHAKQSGFISRPHTLEDFVQKEEITGDCNLKSTFNIDDLIEDEEIWVLDIPGTIDPQQLKGQVLQLGHETKFKIGEDRYCAINKETKSSLTCVFNKNKGTKKYKAVNIKPTGTMSIRRKLSGTSKKKWEFERPVAVPFPKNLKLRHPFFVAPNDSTILKSEKDC